MNTRSAFIPWSALALGLCGAAACATSIVDSPALLVTTDSADAGALEADGSHHARPDLGDAALNHAEGGSRGDARVADVQVRRVDFPTPANLRSVEPPGALFTEEIADDVAAFVALHRDRLERAGTALGSGGVIYGVCADGTLCAFGPRPTRHVGAIVTGGGA